ncbi:MAG: MBL fold metallo-hydrolase [Candidatus Bipolaricaulis sp.]|nr:MBL fold metallo-hydrolase [Candidatus Bipolaricaulis sp.]MDD5645805.1 MBL fold metallo-hydrolase [Candidatus Bipolaricaulis sp.]
MRVTSAILGSLGTNAYLIEIGGRAVLIDPADDSAALYALVGHRTIDWVVNTHGHFDHVGGNWAIPSGGVCIHESDVPYVDRFFPGHRPFERYLHDGDEVVPGLRVIHTPGHSPGSVTLVADGALFAGDLLFAGSIGRTDFPGGSDEAMEASLRRVVALEGDYTVYPGHGPKTTLARERKTNPFLFGGG